MESTSDLTRALTNIQRINSAVKDSGNRRQFDTGAVRDIADGKGRCDLIPLDVASRWMNDNVIQNIGVFKDTCDTIWLYQALTCFVDGKDIVPEILLGVAEHFENGAKKYGENNWQKGIPIHCYIDSAVRHYLKFCAGHEDERHDRAFVWNVMCCIWTCKNKPKLLEEFAKRDSRS